MGETSSHVPLPATSRANPQLASRRTELLALWDRLEAVGATVHRVDVHRLSTSEVAALAAHEARRLRALAERDAPDPAPFDWRAFRARLAANAKVAIWEAA